MTTPDLSFRISAEFGEIKAALAALSAEFKALKTAGSADAAKAVAAVNKELTKTPDAAKEASSAAVRAAQEQAREARRAAQEQARIRADAAREERRQQQALAREKLDADRAIRRQAEKEKREADKRATEQVKTEAKAQSAEARKIAQAAPQITDIAVSLASGQSPFLVALQQGGQLRDIFGGIVPAVRAVGSAILSIVNPVTVFAAAVGGLAAAYLAGQNEGIRFRRTLIETGNQAGVTAGQLQDMAREMDALPGVTQGSAAEAINAVVQTGKIARDQIGTVARAAEQLRSSAGKDIAETVAEFAKLGDDPVTAATELNKRYNFLTGAVLEQIRALQSQGRTQEAATVAINAYADAVDKRAPKIAQNAGILERAWKAVANATREAADAALSIGRDKTPAEQLQDLLNERDARERRIANPQGLIDRSEGGKARNQQRLAQLNAQIAEMQAAEQAAQREADKQAAQSRAVQLQGALTTEAQQYESAAQKRIRAREAISNRAAKAIADAEMAGDSAAAQAIADARDKLLAGVGREQSKVTAAVAAVDAGLVRDTTDRALAELDRLYDRGEIKLADFLGRKAALQRQAVDADIAAARAERASAFEPEEIAKADAEVTKLLRKRAALGADIEREGRDLARQTADQVVELKAQQLEQEGRLEEAAQIRFEREYRALRARLIAENDDVGVGLLDALLNGRKEAIRQQTTDQLADLRARELEAIGDTAGAVAIRAEAQYRDLIKRLTAAGDQAGLELVGRLINLDKSRARFNDLRAEFERVRADLDRGVAGITQQRDTGQIGPEEADTRIAETRRVAIEQLAALNAQLQALAENSTDPAIQQGAKDIADAFAGISTPTSGLAAAMADLRRSLSDIRQSMAQSLTGAGVDALTNLFTDLASGSKSAGDAIKDFVRGFISSMAQIAARALATYLVLQILDAVYPGLGQATAAAMSVGVKHTGGMVGGPGVTRIVNPLLFAGAPRFHSGGMVGLQKDEVPAILQTGERVLNRQETAEYNKGGRGGGYRIVNVLDPSLVSGYLESSAGEEAIVNAIGRNPSRVRQIIGV